MPAHAPRVTTAQGSENSSGTDPQSMAELLRDTGADGFNGDCMAAIPQAFYDAAVRIYKPIAMEGEGGLGSLRSLNWQTLGWCEGCVADEPNSEGGLDLPDVDRVKWVTGGRAMSHWSDRYAGSPESRDQFGGLFSPLWSSNMTKGVSKISEIQTVWFNAVGYETFENVWGTWNGVVERDGEAFRRVGLLLRYFGRRGFFTSPDWAPYTTDVLRMREGLFASSFPSPTGDEVVYTLVNRKMTSITGALLRPARAAAAGMRFYDCYRGVELVLHPVDKTLSFVVEAGGFGCVLATRNASHPRSLWPRGQRPAAYAAVPAGGGDPRATPLPLRGAAQLRPANLSALLATMAALTARGLDTFSGEWDYARQVLTPIAPTRQRPLRNATPSEVYVPGGVFRFDAAGVEVESARGSGCDVQWPWEEHPGRVHSRDMNVGAMYVDKHPVTNAQYHVYLQQSGYVPTDRMRWLERNFEGGKPREGWGDRPVTYVSLGDARSYCAFHGKRLPHAYEWQYFAQGTDGRKYPWGDKDDVGRTSQPKHGFADPGPEPVGAHPSGASPFGVEDLVREVWQYTSEFVGAHTRNVVLRGGSMYSPWRAPAEPPEQPNAGSNWYFRQAYTLDTYNTYHLMAPAYERSGTIGFRCVADAADDCGTDGHLCIRHTPGQPPNPAKPPAPGPTPSLTRTSGGGVSVTPIRTAVAKTTPTHPHQGRPVSELLYPGAGNGFVVEARAPLSPPPGVAAPVATLRLRVGSRLGALGKLTATVTAHTATRRHGDAGAGAGGVGRVLARKELEVRADAAVLSFAYSGGRLTVRYISTEASVCKSTRLCLMPATPTCGARVAMARCVTNISRHTHTGGDVLDWAHWGSTNITLEGTGNTAAADWPSITQRKRAPGPGLLAASLLMPGCSMDQCHRAQSDMRTWGAQFWPSDGARYAWAGGMPGHDAVSGPGARAGVFSSAGTFRLQVPGGGGARKLTLYTGLFDLGHQPDADGAYTNSATLVATTPGVAAPVAHTVTHMDGNNNDFVNTAFAVVFTGELTVTWSLDPPSRGGACAAHPEIPRPAHSRPMVHWWPLRRRVLPSLLFTFAHPTLHPAPVALRPAHGRDAGGGHGMGGLGWPRKQAPHRRSPARLTRAAMPPPGLANVCLDVCLLPRAGNTYGWVSMQAATLEDYSGEVGGVTLLSAELV